MSELKNLTLIIPAKYEAETLPIFLHEIKNIGTKIKIVLEESDTKTMRLNKKFRKFRNSISKTKRLWSGNN